MRRSTSSETALRAAAIAFAKALSDPVADSRDSKFARLDRRLKTAAMRYANDATNRRLRLPTRD